MLLDDVLQCMIIRNTQLAAAREKFEEVEKREKEVNARCSPASLLDRLAGELLLIFSLSKYIGTINNI